MNLKFQKILLPLDGSELAQSAVPYAQALAARAPVEVIMLRILTPREERPVVERELESLAARIRSQRLTVESRLYPGSFTAQADIARDIVQTAEGDRVDLIVMGTHRRGGFDRLLHGSIADSVLRHSAIPLLLIPDGCTHSWPDDRPLRILIPLDGSDLAERAIGLATDLAAQTGAELILLQVIDLAGYGSGAGLLPVNPETDVTAARQYLEGIQSDLRDHGFRVEIQSELGFPINSIQVVAAKTQADAIVMATHGRGGLARVALGSTATGVLQRSDRPLLLVRSVEEMATAEAPPRLL